MPYTLMTAPPVAPAPVAAVPVVNIANVLTTLRLLLVPVFALLLALSAGAGPGMLVAALTVFAVACATDVADGHLARSRGLMTRFGAVADPIADKAMTGTALVGLSLLGLLAWPVTAVVIGREVLVTAMRFAVLHRGVIVASNGGKAKTLLQNLTVVVLLLPVPTPVQLLVIVPMVVITVATGLDYAAKALRMHRGRPA